MHGPASQLPPTAGANRLGQRTVPLEVHDEVIDCLRLALAPSLEKIAQAMGEPQGGRWHPVAPSPLARAREYQGAVQLIEILSRDSKLPKHSLGRGLLLTVVQERLACSVLWVLTALHHPSETGAGISRLSQGLRDFPKLARHRMEHDRGLPSTRHQPRVQRPGANSYHLRGHVSGRVESERRGGRPGLSVGSPFPLGVPQ